MVDRFELLRLPFRVVLDHDLEGPQHRHPPQRGAVEHVRGSRCSNIATSTTLLALATPMRAHEFAQRLRRHAAPAQARKRRHARVVPAGDMAAAHQLGEDALREHRVGEIEPGELVLMRVRGHRQIVEEPVVERPVIFEFEGADRVGDALDGIGLAVGEVVARIDRPGGAGARMVRMEDAVEHGVAQIDVARRHVDLRPQHPRAVRELARPHAAEQVEILLDRAVAERAVPAGLGQGAATDAHLLAGTDRPHTPCRLGSESSAQA